MSAQAGAATVNGSEHGLLMSRAILQRKSVYVSVCVCARVCERDGGREWMMGGM